MGAPLSPKLPSDAVNKKDFQLLKPTGELFNPPGLSKGFLWTQIKPTSIEPTQKMAFP